MQRRILICGSRNWTDIFFIEQQVRLILEGIPDDAEVVIIHGAAKGADMCGDKVAKKLKLEAEVYPADWQRYGRGAGYKRNLEMLDKGDPDLVLAFHDELDLGKGTKHTVKNAMTRHINTTIFIHKYNPLLED